LNFKEAGSSATDSVTDLTDRGIEGRFSHLPHLPVFPISPLSPSPCAPQQILPIKWFNYFGLVKKSSKKNMINKEKLAGLVF
jgi:hypothetical protein